MTMRCKLYSDTSHLACFMYNVCLSPSLLGYNEASLFSVEPSPLLRFCKDEYWLTSLNTWNYALSEKRALLLQNPLIWFQPELFYSLIKFTENVDIKAFFKNIPSDFYQFFFPTWQDSLLWVLILQPDVISGLFTEYWRTGPWGCWNLYNVRNM